MNRRREPRPRAAGCPGVGSLPSVLNPVHGGGSPCAAPAIALEVGDKAPDFTLPGPAGKPVKLSELTAKGPVVVYTFIQAFTNT